MNLSHLLEDLADAHVFCEAGDVIMGLKPEEPQVTLAGQVQIGSIHEVHS
jgi:hypothetical protein